MDIQIIGAKENNLQNIDVKIPLNKLVVFTGLSGSGKSSLAFNTIHNEGQRRYLETFSSYARNFIGNFERPKVDLISGLSPVISIEQKTISKNPRSTVGTITEIHDFLRLLFSKIGKPVSFNTNKKMIQQEPKDIFNSVFKKFKDCEIFILAPLIQSRKGHYGDLFQKLIKKGFVKANVDGEIIKITNQLKLDRYKNHDIDIVIDKLLIKQNVQKRLQNSINLALEESNGSLRIHDIKTKKNKYFSQNLTCEDTGISYPNAEPNTFSFNSPKGYCENCKGIGEIEKIDLDKIITNKSKSIYYGAISPIGEYQSNWIFQQIEIIAKKFNFDLHDPIKNINQDALNAILFGINDTFKIKNKSIGITKKYDLNFEGIINFIESQKKNNYSKKIQRWTNKFYTKQKCEECNGKKLRKSSLHFIIDNKNIHEISELDVFELKKWCEKLKINLKSNDKLIANEILKELINRVNFLINVGLGYLTTSRKTDSLSGGESQRIKIASQIGSELTNVLYILDEPSIGLHPIDNNKLISSLKKLKNIGNSVIVVEHDKSTIEAADYIVDIGPGAGDNGGKITFSGTYDQLKKSESLTAKYLFGKYKFFNSTNRPDFNKQIELIGACGNNLKNVNLNIPIGNLTVVCGVSGSGKSTLINNTLIPAIDSKINKNSILKQYPYNHIKGYQHIDKVINIDQKPIGRTPRSNPATYVNVFTSIRELFSNLNESRVRGYNLGRFSFNVKEGNCKECDGNGYTIVQMKLLPDMESPCSHCMGKRFDNETLEIRYNNKNINDVLKMSVNEAVIFFKNIPKIRKKLKSLKDVGMGYITLGQSSTKLSGGEAQRVKLAAELSKISTGKTLYILDEPTTGLHFHDIEILMKSINLLVAKGNTVIIIEHNIDIIRNADHLIELGPKGGKKGGEIIFTGSVNDMLNNKSSQTSIFLKKEIS
ncbi:MAG: excinuclease ABC subunit A [Flavobacteriales bacterium]|nr:excinuclease ABC subunit A [Flavobacteriales bacterium]